MHRHRAIAPLLAPAMILASVLAGCSSVRTYWPFAGEAAGSPQLVHELAVQVADDAAMPVVLQYWERNTLVVDLQGVPSTGSLSLAPEAGHAWPARLAFRMSLSRFQQLDVRGEQRVLLPVAAGPGPTTAELPAGVYADATARLDLRWGAATF